MSSVTEKTTKATPQRGASKDTFFRKPGEGLFSRKPDSFLGPASDPFFKPRVQPKLTVNEPGDAHEKEADATADKVMRSTDTTIAAPPAEKKEEGRLERKEEENGTEELQRMHDAAAPAAEDDDAGVQRKGDGTPEVTPSFEQGLQNTKGGGSSLPADTRTQMESGIGADFSNVRVHTGTQAAQLSSSIQAQAFTHGSDIYFNEGKYSPGTDGGKHLLAHELTHTVQQGASAPAVARKEEEGDTKEAEKTVPEQPVVTAEAASQPAAAPTAKTTDEKGQVKEGGEKETGEKEEKQKTTEAGTEAAGENNAAADSNAGDAPATGGDTPADNAGGNKPAGNLPEEQPLAGTEEGKQAAGTEAASAAAPAPAIEKAPVDPAQDPGFQSVLEGLKTNATQQAKHPDAATKEREIGPAARGGVGEVDGRAKANQVNKIGEKQPKPFDKGAFKAALMAKIRDITPKNLEQADEFKEKDKAGSIKPALTQQVKSSEDKAQGDIKNTTAEKPSAAGVSPKEVKELKAIPVGKAPLLDGKGAAPKPKTEAEVSQEANEQSKSMDDAYEKDGVTSEQLQQSKEPDFVAADNQKKESQKNISESTVAYRKDEQEMVAKGNADAHHLVGKTLGGMHSARGGKLGNAMGRQKSGKDKDEAARAKVTADLQRIYGDTKSAVETKLRLLDTAVNAMFDGGAVAAKQLFENYVDREMTAYKDRRYAGWRGKGRWIYDKFAGLPDEVNKFYEKGRDLYVGYMDKVLDKIALKVETDLTAATKLVADGRKKVNDYIKAQPKELQAIAKQEGKKILTDFSSLEQTIADKQTALIDTLANKYKENLAGIDKRITEMKEANKGWVAMAMEVVGSVLKAIRDLKNTLLNVLNKAIEVIGAIIMHPIDFLGNLVDAVGTGFKNFAGNILEHLKNGVFEWLMGTMPAGIEFPKTWDLKGIFHFVMQILGLTWPAIRARAVKLLGSEKLVKKLEGAFEIFMVIQNEGLPGLWRFIQEKIGDLKVFVIDAIMSMLQGEIVEAGIKWLLGLLTPAGAFIKACMAIIDIVKWFINNAQKILDLINSIFDSISDIAAGNLTAASNKVEQAMKKIIPITIGFLASLLGIGDLATRVQNIIKKITAPIEKAIDWVLDKAKEFAMKMFSKLMGKGDKKETEGEDDKDDGKLKDKDVTIPAEEFYVEKERHKLFINEQGKVMVASDPKRMKDALDRYSNHADYNTAMGAANSLEDTWSQIKSERDATRKLNLKNTAQQLEDQIVAALKRMHFGDGHKQTMDQAVVHFTPGDGLNRNEYRRQLDLQESEINRMLVGDWQTNRARYIGFERNDKEDTQVKRREAMIEKMMNYPVEAVQALMSQGLLDNDDRQDIEDILTSSLSDAQKREELYVPARAIMRKYGKERLAVLHTLDQVAGGLPTVYGDEHTIFGDTDVNSDIGRKWKDNISIVDNKAKEVIETAHMNVQITM